jgi:glycosyltransferase involved in cell wall biosynthesis
VDLHHVFAVFVQSSDSEGTSNALLEAMALETPVVATAVGGTPELLRAGEDAILVRPGDAGELARAIDACLRDPEAAARRASAARRRVESTLSFTARQRELERIYVELAEQGSRARKGH